MVKVFTKPKCVQCDQTKKDLDKMGIEYSVVDITENIEEYERLVSLGFRGAPVVEASIGSWAGYRPEMISKLA